MNNKLAAMLLKLTHLFAWLPPVFARLAIGVTFIDSGWGKLHNIPKVTEFFTSLGIPYPAIQAPFVAGVEFFGGALVLAGLLTRLASVPLVGTMVVAILTAKAKDLERIWDLFGLEEFLLIGLLVYLIVEGAGVLSLDRVIFGKKK
jgi:putative oxidoreductase